MKKWKIYDISRIGGSWLWFVRVLQLLPTKIFLKTKNITFSTAALTVMTFFLRGLRRKQMKFHVQKEWAVWNWWKNIYY